MAIDKKIANRVLTNLDHTASRIEALAKQGKIEPRTASALVREIDTFADKFQVAAYGLDKFRALQAHVLQRDSDEKFMDTFENPNKLISGDSDEGFMKEFDVDVTNAVNDRDEHTVRDISDLSDPTKKQPSWSRGPAGKSTRQGTTTPAKRWAP